MHLYHLTVLPASAGSVLAYGSFSAARAQEVVVAGGARLTLARLTRAGSLVCVAAADAFGVVRDLAPLRLPGARLDLLLVTSDSGSLCVLEFDVGVRAFVRVRCEAFGRSGCRRVVPGQFLAVDPTGRACMVGAVERGKFAYVVTRGGGGAGEVAVQSPLEAHKPGVATHALVGLDVGFENPMFAALERAYEGDGAKMLVYYELDLGLNHVVRRFASAVDDGSFVLLPVPGGTDGPGGVLVCAARTVSYRNLVEEEEEEEGGEGGKVRLDAALPRRAGAGAPSMVVCGTVHKHKDVFFFVLCTESGDLLKVELDWTEGGGAVEMRVLYFDSLPAPAHALAIFRSGYLFAALESGDSLFLKFNVTSVAPDDPGFSTTLGAVEARSKEAGEGGAAAAAAAADGGGNVAREAAEAAAERRREFVPRTDKMRCFTVVDVLESLAPTVAIASGDFCGEGSSQLVAAAGCGRQATLRVLRRGFAVLELMAQTLPGVISSVFTLRERRGDAHDRYIVVSFVDATKVLRVSDDAVVEASDTGLVRSAATIGVAQVGTSSLLQVHAGGVRLVPAGRPDEALEWGPAAGAKVVAAAINGAQAVVALSSGDVAYFEFGGADACASLEPAEVLPGAVAAVAVTAGEASVPFPPALALPDVPAGRLRASFFAVADGQSSMVRLYQVGADGEVKSVGVHMAPAPVDSIALVDFGDLSGEALASAQVATVSKKASKAPSGDDAAAPVPVEPMFCLVVGTRKGALILLRVDPMTGAMSGKRAKFLGPRAVRVQRLRMAGVPSCFALSVRPWLMHRQGARIATSPLCTDAMQCVASFSSEQFPDGFVAVSGSTLRFLSLESLAALAASAALPARLPASLIPADTALGSTFFLSKSSLLCTPRRIAAVCPPGTTAVAPRAAANGNGAADAAVPAAHPAAGEGLFVVLEAQHRAGLRDGGDGERAAARRVKKTGSSLALVDAGCGSWASQVRLVSIKQFGADEEGEAADVPDAVMNDAGDGNGEVVEEEDEEEEDMYAKAATTLDCVSLPKDDACALCVATATALGGLSDVTPYVIVSVARHVALSATSPSAAAERQAASGGGDGDERPGPSGELHVFKVNTVTRKLELVHVTPVGEPVYAMAAFRDKLLVGVGTSLRLYDLGKKQLLRKAEARMVVANKICALAVAGGDRIFVGDVQDSVTLFKYYPPSSAADGAVSVAAAGPIATGRESGRFVPVARDGVSRYIVTLLSLDYSTVCGSDKFGNVFVLRVPPELSGAEVAGGRSGPQRNSALHPLAVEACFHVGSTVTSLARGTLRGGSGVETRVGSSSNDDGESIIYSTMGGAIGVLTPFAVKSDADLAIEMEKELRLRYDSLAGRSHVSYRSSFAPVRHVIDGDLCEMFVGLSRDAQLASAVRLERDLSDVLRKLDEFRANVV